MVQDNRPTRYRARAGEAREKAIGEPNEVRRKALWNDAEMWDRMADDDEKNPVTTSRPTTPQPLILDRPKIRRTRGEGRGLLDWRVRQAGARSTS
jgi:hypothetical protein